MDSPTPQPTDEIRKVFQELLPLENVGKEKQEEIFSTLEDAIVMNMTTSLLNGLPEDAKPLLENEHFQSYTDLMIFLQKVTPKEGFEEAATHAVREILGDFLGHLEHA